MVHSVDGSASAGVLSECFTHQNHHQRHVVLFVVPQLRYTCAATGADCSAVRYRCTRRADVDLCPAAFAEGRFPAGTSARDFVRIDSADQPQVRHCRQFDSAGRTHDLLAAEVTRAIRAYLAALAVLWTPPRQSHSTLHSSMLALLGSEWCLERHNSASCA
jgi:hypothetical protein